MHNAPCITSVRELGGAELRAGSGRSQSRVGEVGGCRCGEKGRWSFRRCCCLESLRLSSPSQQMAQELVWDGGGLRLPDPLSLSLLLSPPPARSSCPGSSWSPDGRQFLLRADLSCPVALASLGWGPEILVHSGFSTGSWPHSPSVPGSKNSWVPVSV